MTSNFFLDILVGSDVKSMIVTYVAYSIYGCMYPHCLFLRRSTPVTLGRCDVTLKNGEQPAVMRCDAMRQVRIPKYQITGVWKELFARVSALCSDFYLVIHGRLHARKANKNFRYIRIYRMFLPVSHFLSFIR